MVDEQLITSSNQLEGYKIIKHLGIVRGITVRSRSSLEILQAGYKPYSAELFQFMLTCAKKQEQKHTGTWFNMRMKEERMQLLT